MKLMARKSKKKIELNPEVFIYDLVMDILGSPSQRYLYESLNRNAPGSETRRLLGAFKVPYVSCLLDRIDDKRYVCICPDIETARMLYNESPIGTCCATGEYEYDSYSNVKSFNDGNHEHLMYAGTDIPELKDVEAVVFVQSSDKDLAYVQELGKAMSNADNPKLYFFMFHDSIDDTYRIIAQGISPDKTTEVNFPYHILQQ